MTKHPESAMVKARRFFTENPDEELTYELIAAKFGVSIWHARFIVRELEKEGLVENVTVIRNRQKGIAR